ncbi:probable isoaspartyl peptidase/L-asparaginase GA20639 [Diabrotica virgifera virgifera]|uniref:Isoaspartyl peptidase/L-asparaginase-like n=1 Tax=Diabrotica virgifera virgifera TaxID=50390 RepID=A0ABM5IW90_DIAVI|nr:probable isoaspartyl peptidase/L-asparaginase GA20639 [Diabrotica virgifera virgifera]
MEPIIIIHGGADDVPDSMVVPRIEGVKTACNAGYNALIQPNATALDAIEAAINSMEADEMFNSGFGSVLNEEGDIEMDAAVMVGENLSTGGLTVVKEILHPISLARQVMEKTPHVLLAGEGAGRFADSIKMPRVPTSQLLTSFAVSDLEQFKKSRVRRPCKYPERCDTVGAVAIDRNGHIAAGTSTGGLTGKMVGRSSDSSKVGCGLYADDRYGGVSVTGHGESIVKVCLSFNIINNMKLGMPPQEAAQTSVNEVINKFNKQTGAVVLSKNGDMGVFCRSERMPWAFRKGNKMLFGSHSGDHQEQNM